MSRRTVGAHRAAPIAACRAAGDARRTVRCMAGRWISTDELARRFDLDAETGPHVDFERAAVALLGPELDLLWRPTGAVGPADDGEVVLSAVAVRRGAVVTGRLELDRRTVGSRLETVATSHWSVSGHAVHPGDVSFTFETGRTSDESPDSDGPSAVTATLHVDHKGFEVPIAALRTLLG